FKTAEINGVRVATAETVRVPVALEVGAVTASVEVTADAAGVEVESASVGGVTNQGLVETLPNLNDNPFYFATLLPGVVGRDVFAGNSFNNNARGITRPAFKVNTFGATLGGRIPKTRLFFFISYEGLVHHRRIDYSKNVPTPAERSGDFSGSRVSVNGVGVPL